MFELQYTNKCTENLPKFQKISRPGNWNVVLELSHKKMASRKDFDHIELYCQIHVFKVNTCRVFKGSCFDRIHIYSGPVEFYDSCNVNKSVDLHVNLAEAAWVEKYPNEADRENALMIERKNLSRKEALDIVEGVVKSISKKDFTKLRKSDFAYFNTDCNGQWHVFYPTINTLIDHHLEKPLDEQNIDYLKFLEGDVLKQLRKEWESEIGVTPGE
jgi:hypothetical protein